MKYPNDPSDSYFHKHLLASTCTKKKQLGRTLHLPNFQLSTSAHIFFSQLKQIFRSKAGKMFFLSDSTNNKCMGAPGNNNTNSECKFAPHNNTTIDGCIVVFLLRTPFFFLSENSDYKHIHFACRAILEHKSHSTILLTRHC